MSLFETNAICKISFSFAPWDNTGTWTLWMQETKEKQKDVQDVQDNVRPQFESFKL